VDLIDELDAVLLEHEKREKLHHYPSEASACIRQTWYKWQGFDPTNPIEAGALWKMSMGNSIHKIVPELLARAGYEVEEEKDVEYKHPKLDHLIKGRMDILFRRPDSVWEVMEVKSSYGRGILQTQQSGAPKQEHYDQLILYLHMADIDTGCLLYLGRDNAYRTIFTVHKDDTTEHRFNNLLNRFAMVEHYLKTEKTPPREFTVAIVDGEIKSKFQHHKQEYKGDWQCSYCAHNKKCWANILAQPGKFFGEERIA